MHNANAAFFINNTAIDENNFATIEEIC